LCHPNTGLPHAADPHFGAPADQECHISHKLADTYRTRQMQQQLNTIRKISIQCFDAVDLVTERASGL